MKKNLLKIAICFAFVIFVLSIGINVGADDTNSDIPVGNQYHRFGYTGLSEDEKYVYDLIASAAGSTPPAETVPLDKSRGIVESTIEKAFSVFLCDYPEYFWVDNQYSYSREGDVAVSITLAYVFSGDELESAKTAFNDKVSEIIGEMPNGNNYEKALYLHNAVAQRVEYEQVGLHQTAYGALVDGKAVCAGYAAAYQYLLRCAGINAGTVTGSSVDPSSGVEIPHAWNIVWMDAETCVYTDVTWDDQGENLFFYYFNVSLDEIKVDHAENIQLFTLPACTHTDQSYFDVNSLIVTNESTPDNVAGFFGAITADGKRNASMYYDCDTPVSQWLSDNIADIYLALNGSPYEAYGYEYSLFGNELYLSISGSFDAVYRDVVISAGDNLTVMGKTEQTVPDGAYIEGVTVVAADGYYFPANYQLPSLNGISVSRIDKKTLVISGKPQDNVIITLSSPSVLIQSPTPSVSFVATGSDEGYLTGFTSSTYISRDLKEWLALGDDEMIYLSELTPMKLYFINIGDGGSVEDSEIQTIEITRSPSPTISVTQPTKDVKSGCISGSTPFEISQDFTDWIKVDALADDLPFGEYFIRSIPEGTVLASLPQTVLINCGHSELEEVGESLPTCTKDGVKAHFICMICNALISSDKFTALEGAPTVPKDPNNHSFGAKYGHDREKHWLLCECGEKSEENEHEFGEWTEIDASSQSKQKKESRSCKTCGYTEARYVKSQESNTEKDNDDDSDSGKNERGSFGCSLSAGGSALTFIAFSAAVAFCKRKKKY